ncbi:MAG: hypothetical protein JXA68_10300 [Ignavibacteriales bacterium]|nr:hypothetical protein [Ignavibacteriales bacterium]
MSYFTNKIFFIKFLSSILISGILILQTGCGSFEKVIYPKKNLESQVEETNNVRIFTTDGKLIEDEIVKITADTLYLFQNNIAVNNIEKMYVFKWNVWASTFCWAGVGGLALAGLLLVGLAIGFSQGFGG